MLESMVCRRSANTAGSAPGSSRSTCARWRITLRSGMSPFLMSWLIWRARSPTVARRSASRTRAVLVRSRAARSPSSRDNRPTSSVPGVELDVEAIEIEHGRLVGKGGQRPADTRRHPHRQQQCGDAGARGGQEKPGIRAAQKRPERRQRLRHLRDAPARPRAVSGRRSESTESASSPTAASVGRDRPCRWPSTDVASRDNAATRRSRDRAPAARETRRPPRRRRRS